MISLIMTFISVLVLLQQQKEKIKQTNFQALKQNYEK
jgi:hypothetical protein